MKVLALVVGLLASVIASAQFGDMGADLMNGPMATLPRPDIQKELKFSKEQSKQIDEIMKNLSTGSDAASMGNFGKIESQFIAILDDRQKQRYFELSIQIRGAIAICDPEVAKKLEMSEGQSASAKRIRKETQSKVFDALRKGSRDTKLMENASKALEKELLVLLTEDQMAALTKLAGVIYKGARIKGMWPI